MMQNTTQNTTQKQPGQELANAGKAMMGCGCALMILIPFLGLLLILLATVVG